MTSETGSLDGEAAPPEKPAPPEVDLPRIERAVREILAAVGEDPDREGLQIWYAVEKHNPGVYLVDKDGRTIFKEPFRHAHFGWVARHTATVPGLQPHTAEDARHEYGAAGAGMRESGHFPIFLSDSSHWMNLTDLSVTAPARQPPRQPMSAGYADARRQR